jgi:EmrB/QacA subfamily drug resistance transporter
VGEEQVQGRDTDFSPQLSRRVLVAAILASSMAFIDQTALNVALPALQAALKASGAQLLWVINGYNLLLASLMLVGGSLGDRLGRRRIFMTGIGLFGLASLACGLTPGAAFLIGARAVQGVGGALMVPGSLTLITTFFPQERRGRAIGTWAAATTITTVAGPLLGGLLAQAGLWRAVFFINVPLAVASLLVLALSVPESRPREAGRIDLGGAALVSLGLAGLAYAFISAPAAGFAAPQVYGALAGGAAALGGFLLLERRLREPMVRLELFRSRTFLGANLLTLFLYGGLAAYSLFLPLVLVQAQGYGESQAGLALLPFALILAGMSRAAGRLADRMGPRTPLTVGPAVVAVGMGAQAFIGLTSGPGQYWGSFFPAIVVVGVGMGITVAPLSSTVMGALAGEFTGTASGVNNATARIAGVLAVAVLGAVALLLFQGAVARHTAGLDLPAAAQAALREQAANLGQATVPRQVPAGESAAVAESLRRSFVDTYRVIAGACAALAAAGALMGALLVEKHPRPFRPE